MDAGKTAALNDILALQPIGVATTLAAQPQVPQQSECILGAYPSSFLAVTSNPTKSKFIFYNPA